MTVSTFTVRMDHCDADIAADAMAAVFNVATDCAKYVAICEVRIVPKAINDDTTNILGSQGILALERITAASGGTEIAALKYDTNAAALPSAVKVRNMPTSITISGGALRRFGDCVSTLTVTKALPLRVFRAPGVIDMNDHSGRTSESQDIWHADGIAATEPIVLREGEGVAVVKRAWGIPQAMRVGLVVRVASTGNVYRWNDQDLGTPCCLDEGLISLMNESGSGVVLQVYIVTFPDLGEENIPRYRLVKTGTEFDVWPGEAVSLVTHDTAATITEVECYRGPMRVKPFASGEGAITDYWDYQVADATTAIKQKPDAMRMWLGAGPYVRTTGSPAMMQEVLSRGEPEVWPGDRRGVGGGLNFPIILRPGQGLAVVGGGNGPIETSEQAYLDIEFCGYVYTPAAGGGGGAARVIGSPVVRRIGQ
jgi:hypothetical protein